MTIHMRGDRFARQKEVAAELKRYSAAYNIEQPKVVLNPYGQAPLTAVLCFSTQFPEQFIVAVNGFSWLSERTTEHVVPVVALQAGVANVVQLKQGETVRATVTICPEPLPEKVAETFGTVNEPNTLFVSLPADDEHFPAAYDGNGHCHWVFTEHLSHFWKKLSNGHFLTGAAPNVAPPYGPTALWEMDLLGRIYAEYRLPGGVSNDIVELPDSTLVVISQQPDGGTAMDELLWLNRNDGTIEKHLAMKTVLPPGYGSPAQSGSDWCHLSSVRYDDEENLLWLTAEMANAVIAVDAATATVRKVFVNNRKVGAERMNPVSSSLFQQVDDLAEPAAVYPQGNSIFVLMSNRFADKRRRAPLTLVRLNAITGQVECQEMVDKALRSPILNDFCHCGDGFILHAGGLSDGPLHEVGLFERYETPSRLLWSEGVFFNEHLGLRSRYRIGAASYGLWPVALSEASFCGDVRGVMGQWGEPVKVDVRLPVTAEEEDLSDFALSMTIDGGRLIVSATYFQGEATALVLDNGLEQLTYFIQNNRRPYGAQWLCSQTERPERRVNWGVPLPETKGDWQVGLWIDGTFYRTGEMIRI